MIKLINVIKITGYKNYGVTNDTATISKNALVITTRFLIGIEDGGYTT